MSIRKIRKLGRAMLTGKIECRHCGQELSGRFPLFVLRRAGMHYEEKHG